MLGTQRVQQWMAAVRPLPALLLAEAQDCQRDRPDDSPSLDAASASKRDSKARPATPDESPGLDAASASGCDSTARLATPAADGEPLRDPVGRRPGQGSSAGLRLVIALPASTDTQLCKAVAAFFGPSHNAKGGGHAASALPMSSFTLRAKEATAVTLLIVLTEQALAGTEDITHNSPCDSWRADVSGDGSDTSTSSTSDATSSGGSTASGESSQEGVHIGSQSPYKPFDGSAIEHNTRASQFSDEQSPLPQPPPKEIGLTHPITQLVATLTSEQLCRVLLAMRVHSPASLEGLLLYALPPAATEVLLSSLESAQQLAAMQAHSPDFYGAVWSVAPSSKKLLSTLLAQKELCCEMACRQVLSETVGW